MDREASSRSHESQDYSWSDKAQEDIPRVASMPKGEDKNRDYAAICVFCLALVILLLSLFLLWRDFRVHGPNFLQDIRQKVENSLGKFDDDSDTDLGPYGEKSEHLQKGYRLYKADRFEEALKELEAAVEEKPDDSVAYFWRARAFLKMQKYEKALQEFKKSEQLDPKNAETHANLGWLYGRRGEYQESIRHLSMNLELDPDNGWAYYNRGLMYQKTGEREMALRDVKKACDLGFRLGCEVYNKYKRAR